MDFEHGVPFDPGYSAHTYVFSDCLESFNAFLGTIKQFNRKKVQFQMQRQKLCKLFENSTAFYLGCLLWAAFIKFNFKSEPKEILNNAFFGQEVPDEDVFYEINALLAYYEKYPKDCAYYTGKSEEFPKEWLEIFTVYKDFLTINKNFKEVKNTSQIELPEAIKEPAKPELARILEKIETVTKSGRLEELFEIKELILPTL